MGPFYVEFVLSPHVRFQPGAPVSSTKAHIIGSMVTLNWPHTV